MRNQKFFLAAMLLVMALFGSGIARAQSYDGLNRRLLIINNSSLTIWSLYASTIDKRSWQEDILGRKTIPPGKTVIANIDDGSGYCRYDFRAVMEDGSEAIRYNVNVCEAVSWVIHD